MKFGTLHNFVRSDEPSKPSFDDNTENPSSLAGMDDNTDDLEFNFDVDDNSEELNASGDDSGTNPIVQKLIALKSEIDEILADMGFGDEMSSGSDFSDEEPSFGDDEFAFDDEDQQNSTEDEFPADFGEKKNFDDEVAADDNPEVDPNFQGNIRTVQGANLVYKRKVEDGNFEELWIYNVGKDIRKETQIRKAILAGTDIVPSQRESEDGEQKSETYTVGNVQYLKITGLPN